MDKETYKKVEGLDREPDKSPVIYEKDECRVRMIVVCEEHPTEHYIMQESYIKPSHKGQIIITFPPCLYCAPKTPEWYAIAGLRERVKKLEYEKNIEKLKEQVENLKEQLERRWR